MADEAADKAEAQSAFLQRLPEHLRHEIFDFFTVQTEWGTKVRPGKAGLRLGDLNVGSYGVVKDVSDNRSLRAPVSRSATAASRSSSTLSRLTRSAS